MGDIVPFLIVVIIILAGFIFVPRFLHRSRGRSHPATERSRPVTPSPPRADKVAALANPNPSAPHGPEANRRFRLGEQWIEDTGDIPLIVRVEQDAAAAAILDGSLEKWLRDTFDLRPVADLLMTIAGVHQGDGPAAVAAYLRAQIPPRRQHVIPLCPHCGRILPVALHPRWPWKCATCGHPHQTDNPVMLTCDSCGGQAATAPCPHCGLSIDLDSTVQAVVPNREEVDLPPGRFAIADFLQTEQIRFSKVLVEREARPVTQELADYIFNLTTGLVFNCSLPARSLFVASGEVRFLPESSHLACLAFDKPIEEILQLESLPEPVGRFTIRCGGPSDPMPKIA